MGFVRAPRLPLSESDYRMKCHKIDAVVKLTERCNINCTYCYMFNKDSRLFESKPKQMSAATAREVAVFLAQGAVDTQASIVRIVLHGGEPMMMRPADFDRICQIFIDVIAPVARVQFTIQTNATLVDERWIALIEKYCIGVGISLDGDRAVNDSRRIDHRGRGTYDRSVAGCRKLFEAHAAGRIARPAVLCVIDPEQDGAATFLHLVQEIGFKWLDFMLPIDTRDTLTPDVARGVGVYLRDVFTAWQALGDREVSIRFFDGFYTFMTGYDRASGRALEQNDGTLILTVASDGTYGPDDTLRIVSDDYFVHDCRDLPLRDYLRMPAIAEIQRANATPAAECQECAWAAFCVGGSMHGRVVNRYSRANGYAGRSGLCEGLMSIYVLLARHMIERGYPADAMYDRLDRAAARLQEAVAA